eukprot:CAMPEP_0117436036 /NCGR_PEP_ID=MMETSP0759-20121206/800_1 /TAXON_ID=63605 /ORGANISM="Percolomonas cosmopolitus, Strain WS" /LENGTH=226 /DNA_ID=CAMNT_0005227623 /DNA_START=19 /DNA_END=696 /DNA_ORIENTATION=-
MKFKQESLKRLKPPTKQAKLTFFHPKLVKKSTTQVEKSTPGKPTHLIKDIENNTVVRYFPNLIPRKKSLELYEKLRTNTDWHQERILMFGKWFEPSRKVQTAGDDGLTFEYSGTQHNTVPWSKELLEIKELVEKALDYNNFAVLNFYKDGSSQMGWHADDRGSMVDRSIIASVSLGASRKFRLRRMHLTKGTGTEVLLGSGDLLTMEEDCQKHYKHCVPKQMAVKE